MTISVELSEKEIRAVRRFTGERKKGPAVRKLVLDALMLKRRREIAQKFVSAQWGVEFADLEASRAADRRASEERAKRWRE